MSAHAPGSSFPPLSSFRACAGWKDAASSASFVEQPVVNLKFRTHWSMVATLGGGGRERGREGGGREGERERERELWLIYCNY